jgi:hypothetical protein
MRWYRQLPFGVYSVLLSMGVGVILWLTDITGEEAAVLAAIGLELVVVVHRVHFDLQRMDDPVRTMVRNTELAEAVVAAREILKSKNPQARVLLESAVQTFANRIKELRTGWARFSTSDFMEWAEGLFSGARPGHTLQATSHLGGGEYWRRNYGRRYEALNRSAQALGLSIQRIYIFRDAAHLDEFREVLDRQAEFTDIRTILLDEGDNSMRLPHRDFFVYNGDVVAEFHFAEPGMVLSHIQITTEREQVKSMAAEYARMRDAFSRPYTPTARSVTK